MYCILLSQISYNHYCIVDIEFYIGAPYELHYRTPRIVMFKDFDAKEYLSTFKGDLDILRLTSDNPTDFIGVRVDNSHI